ncbi:MAG TPA: ABC transporter permease [Steroidobacteraceae bacterium]|jgi:phospholipid/cholesterol/gamma-HCH transport system permease protein|nr:ABC transporter permease [Steroidobacteraceae bacterium]
MLDTELHNNQLLLRLSGHWTVNRLEAIEKALSALPATEVAAVSVDCTALEQSDLGPMWLLRHALQAYQRGGAHINYVAGAPEHFAFLDDLQVHTGSPHVTREATLLWPEKVVATFGKRAVKIGKHALGHLDHFGRIVITEFAALRQPQRFRPASIARHVYETGINAIPIVSLIAFFVAVIIAYIGASQLRSFGATIYTVDLITVGVLRELGVLLTAVIVAGRSGSAFAAEIGVMQLNDEVDALKSIGIDPIEVLVVPRVIGLIIALPLLTIIADAMGLAGGALLSKWLLDLSLSQFLSRVQDALASTTFWAGLIKAPVFALLIGMIGTYRGMQVRESSRELGRLTTTAVVESIFMVIFANAVFAVVFVELDF